METKHKRRNFFIKKELHMISWAVTFLVIALIVVLRLQGLLAHVVVSR